MVVAAKGVPRLWLMVATLVGGALSAGGANAANMFVDRDIDAVMHRTRHRPIVTGAVTPTAAVVFSIVLEVAAFLLLWRAVNLFSAFLALAAALFYVFVYSVGLKRRSTQNIVIGGAAGAVPVLVGWTAVTDRLAWPALVLFAMIVIWTPSHFWALAVRYKDDYKAANVPMLPAVVPFERVRARDHPVLAGVRRHFVRVRRRRPHRVDLLGCGHSCWRPLPGRRTALASREGITAERHAVVRVLDHLHHRCLRGDGCRRDRPLPLTWLYGARAPTPI